MFGGGRIVEGIFPVDGHPENGVQRRFHWGKRP
jgi:hypothetical protein